LLPGYTLCLVGDKESIKSDLENCPCVQDAAVDTESFIHLGDNDPTSQIPGLLQYITYVNGLCSWITGPGCSGQDLGAHALGLVPTNIIGELNGCGYGLTEWKGLYVYHWKCNSDSDCNSADNMDSTCTKGKCYCGGGTTVDGAYYTGNKCQTWQCNTGSGCTYYNGQYRVGWCPAGYRFKNEGVVKAYSPTGNGHQAHYGQCSLCEQGKYSGTTDSAAACNVPLDGYYSAEGPQNQGPGYGEGAKVQVACPAGTASHSGGGYYGQLNQDRSICVGCDVADTYSGGGLHTCKHCGSKSYACCGCAKSCADRDCNVDQSATTLGNGDRDACVAPSEQAGEDCHWYEGGSTSGAGGSGRNCRNLPNRLFKDIRFSVHGYPSYHCSG